MSQANRKLAAIMFTDVVGYSAIVGRDEAAGAEIRDRHARLVKTLVDQFHGDSFQEVGDESLSTFKSAIDAVNCALAVQGVLENDPELSVRIGIHIGDVLERDGQLVGDGVNLAARLRPMAEPGGICVSERVCDDMRSHPEIRATFLGAQELKNIDRPVRVYSLMRSASDGRGPEPVRKSLGRGAKVGIAAGIALALGIGLLAYAPARDALIIAAVRNRLIGIGPTYDEEIAFTRASDGVRIAYSTAGEGPPIVIVLGWFTHLKEGAASSGFNMWAPPLMDQHQIIQYDGRATGLSDRGVADLSLDAKVRDLEAVVDAAGLEQFALYAISAGGPTAIAYTYRHPDRVTRLAFYGSFTRIGTVRGQRERWEAFPGIVRVGWGEDNPAYRQLFTSLFMPDAEELETRIFNQMQKTAATPDDAARFIESLLETDVREIAPEIRVPALVAHVRGDAIVPFESGRELASLIPGARLVTFEGRNHMIGGDEPSFEELNETLRTFFAGKAPAP